MIANKNIIDDNDETLGVLSTPMANNRKKKKISLITIYILEFRYLLNEMFKEQILRNPSVFSAHIIYTLTICTILSFVYINVDEQDNPFGSTLQLFLFCRTMHSAIVFCTTYAVFMIDREKRLPSLLPEKGKIIFSTFSVFFSKILILFLPKISFSILGYILIY